MKLSIAILSSILLACSVTVADPVLDSSTTSTATSTSSTSPSATATSTSSTSPSATATSGTSHSKSLYSYIQYMNNCYPIGVDALKNIELLALASRKLDILSQYIDKKKAHVNEQKKVIDELQDEIDHLKNNPSSTESEMAKLEYMLTDYNEVFTKLKKDLVIIFKRHSRTCQETTKLRRKLKGYFKRHHPGEEIITYGGPYLNRYPIFTRCFHIFYNGALQLPKLKYDAILKDPSVWQ
ncbi:hypothetical protein BATDEDRAFT_92471 [Batrachochytrium dendrobatidis JAM81]|uniref:Uncharacterized protein n=1 Tax=Batrachochytrium dendrobatidis (strain JAM81 / FGSC 10211) TaxID=684364 RepID=F4PDH5_BATDJ|nr:uncharacterized protein BATDEDRAFT_92471 [Batrachochytrium dendrobatidis JAM81]EGF76678.1 hypothetical protein BATDEDRAFT_92471 [Batrachochytrium dendrobatidis JAM81]KAK5666888.1 hypothetical protein QVD99_006519 [Batrachochytrium dendrobatidis]|eukprot:XP_006682685.1 hypothetical protein BATDEDRAFT_92471 [Batrachochytrium dendrobatidis JAM81]